LGALFVSSLLIGCGAGSSSSTAHTLNPQPAIADISPDAAPIGSGSQTLTINGAGFSLSSTVTFNGVSHTIGFMNSRQLSISLEQVDLSNIGDFAVVVINPSPGGGQSNSVNFRVQGGTVQIQFIGLPAGVTGSLSVVSPTGFNSTITSDQSLQLPPATYALTANAVPVANLNYFANPTQQTLDVSDGSSSSVQVPYTTVVPNTTKVLDQVGMASLFVSADGATLTMSGQSAVAASLAAGDTVVSAPTTAAPHGLLREITSVVQNNGQVVATTVQGTLAAAIQQANVQFNAVLSSQNIKSTKALRPGVAVSTSKRETSRKTSMTTLDSDPSSDDICSGGQIVITESKDLQIGPVNESGEIEVCGNIQMQASMNWATGQLNSMTATLTLADHTELDVTGIASASSFNETNDIATIEFEDILFFVGPVPVDIVPVVTIQAGANGSIGAGFTTGMMQNTSVTGGFSYANGQATPVLQSTPLSFQIQPISLDAGLTVSAFVGANSSLMFYDVAGPYFDPQAYLQFNANILQNPWWTLSGGLQGPSGLEFNPELDDIYGFDNLPHLSFPDLFNISQVFAQASGGFLPSDAAPTVTSVTPTTASVGGAGLTLGLNGTNFVPGVTANFNGTPLATTFVSSTQITAILPSADLLSVGTFSVTATNPDVQGATSNAVNFTVSNPVPSISFLSPSSLAAGSASQSLSIDGAGFMATSTATFNGITHAPTFVSASQLSISLSASDLGTAGSFPVVVTNPQPGGGTSNSVEFLVVNAPTGTVTISPQAVSVAEGGLQTFSATVAGGGEVTWSVEEGSQGGTITSAGVYAAPKTAGTFHVVATNAANSSLTATATVTVVPLLPVGTISTVAGGGFGCSQQKDTVGDGCPSNLAELVRPSGVATDQAGNIYISDTDTNRIRVVNTRPTAIVVGGVTIQPGTIAAVVGNGSQGYSGDGGSPSAAELDAPGHLTLDGAGNIFVSDSYNHVVRLVNTQTTAITYAGVTIQPNSIATIAGAGAGCANQTDSVGDGCPATAGQMNLPDGIALDRNNNLYIADFYGERIRRVDASTGVITTVAGDGYGGFSGDGGPATSAELYNPSRISVDAAGNLYIADFYNNRLRRIDGATGNITTLAGTGIYGYSGDGGPAMNAELNPLSVVVDAAGNVFIADNGNQRIRVVNTQSTAITVLGVSVLSGDIQTVVGNGSTGYSGDGGPATSATIDGPTGLWFDSSGNLYFADSINGVIRKVTGP
jgi:sugar lactone lactonase YvrE